MKRTILFVLQILVLLAGGLRVFSQGTAFVYQGRLNDGSTPANGIYDLQFTLYEREEIDSKVVGRPIRMREVPVSNGLFTVTLDFGERIFTGPERWLEIGVTTKESGAELQTLRPRQRITATPYAIFSSTAGAVENTGNSPLVFSAGGAEAMRIDAAGNVEAGAGTRPAQVTVNGSIQAMATTFLAEGFEDPSFPPAGWTTGGFYTWNRTTNTAYAGSASAMCTVSQGNGYLEMTYNFPRPGTVRFAWKLTSTSPCPCAFLGLCIDNDDPHCWYFAPTRRLTTADIGYWKEETVPVSAGVHSFRWWVGHNTALAPGDVTGFLDNVRFTDANGDVFVDGKLLTQTIKGGTAEFQKVGIGTNYHIASDRDNFVIRDDTAGADRFAIDASGQITCPGNLAFGAQTRQMLNLWDTAYGIGVQASTLYSRSDFNFAWYRGGTHDGGVLNPGGGTEMMRLTPTELRVNGTFVSSSDRNVKAGFEPVDPKAILEKVATLPIARWHYTNDTRTVHIGPVAQDFKAAFNVGFGDKHIATVDADGVALAAIQGLNRKLQEKEVRIEVLERTVAELKQMVDRLAPR